ncbi:hypothetical protein ACX80E_14405 [Arthrobacter sp. TMN-49]
MDGLSLSESATYLRIAADTGLDSDHVARLYADPNTRTKAIAEQERATELEVNSYPLSWFTPQKDRSGSEAQSHPPSNFSALSKNSNPPGSDVLGMLTAALRCSC